MKQSPPIPVLSGSTTHCMAAAAIDLPVALAEGARNNAVLDALPGKKRMISVFMPCTPNPTTGFYFYVPADDVIELAVSADEAAKLEALTDRLGDAIDDLGLAWIESPSSTTTLRATRG